MGPFGVKGTLYFVCNPLECMWPFRVYGALYTVWALKSVWGSLECMGPFRVHGAFYCV